MSQALRRFVVGALALGACSIVIPTAAARLSQASTAGLPTWYRVVAVQGHSRWDYDVTKLDSDGAPHLTYRGFETATLGLRSRVVGGLEGRALSVSIPLAGPVTGQMNWTNSEGTWTCNPAFDLSAVGGNVTVELRRAAHGRVASSAAFNMAPDAASAGCADAVFNVPVGGVFGMPRAGLDGSPETPTGGSPACAASTLRDLCTTLPASALQRRRFTVAFRAGETETRDAATFTGQLTVTHTLRVTFERAGRSLLPPRA